MSAYALGFAAVIRYVLPFLSVLLLCACFVPLLKKQTRSRAFLLLEDATQQPVCRVDNVLGSAKDCDVRLPNLAEHHAVLTVNDRSVLIKPLKGHRVYVNKQPVSGESKVSPYDVISVGGHEFTVRRRQSKNALKAKKPLAQPYAVLLLFEFFLWLSFVFTYIDTPLVPALYGAFVAAQCVFFAVSHFAGGHFSFIICYLISLGFTVTAPLGTKAVVKQWICLAIGLLVSAMISFVMKSEDRVVKFKIPAAVSAVALFAFNILYGSIYNGSQNWLSIRSISFQPSELIKVLFIFLSAAGSQLMLKQKNLLGFSLFTLFCIGVLAYLRDFGTALVYFLTYLTVLILRQCPWKIILSVLAGAAVCGGGIVMMFPYVSKRLFSFGQAWSHAYDTGYQQTRTMVAAASGGLFGVGGGKGCLRGITASDTDIVFGLLAEEYGMIMALCAVLCFALLLFYAVHRFSFVSLYHAIPGCAAAVLLLSQAALNVFGSVDMLPFTGVTLPFISNGGSSLLACMALTAFFTGGEQRE